MVSTRKPESLLTSRRGKQDSNQVVTMKTKYQEQAEKFLEQSGTSMDIVRVGVVRGFPFDKRDRNPHIKYSVTMRRGNLSYTFPFYDSVKNYKVGASPTEYDILACVTKYPVDPNVWVFAKEFGYTIDSEESFNYVLGIHQSLFEQYRRLTRMFGGQWMERLREIN